MWGSTRIPSKVYQALYPLQKHCRCVQARHFWSAVGWYSVEARSGQRDAQGLQAYLPSTLQYRTTLRMMRSGQWDAQAVVGTIATATLRTLPPPTDSVLSLIGESTLRDKRGRTHPLGHTTRHSAHDP
jgi:hypothetical protein